MVEPLLSIQDLSVRYQTDRGEVRAVQDLSLDLEPGESLGVVGESGSGKSTLALAIMGLLPPAGRVTAGSIRLGGRRITGLGEDQLRSLRWAEVAMVFQKAMSALSPVHRIRTHVEDIYRVHRPRASAREVLDRARTLFCAIGLRSDVLNAYPHELSGGMLQRVMIVLALLHSPRLLILDEPTTALDVITQGQVLAEVGRLRREMDLATLVITHDIAVVASLCDRVAVMYAGELVETGPVDRVFRQPLHPYTSAFVCSFPRLRGAKERIEGIPGSLPDLTVAPAGCVFAPRCPGIRPQCRSLNPPLHGAGGHLARCHFPNGGEERA